MKFRVLENVKFDKSCVYYDFQENTETLGRLTTIFFFFLVLSGMPPDMVNMPSTSVAFSMMFGERPTDEVCLVMSVLCLHLASIRLGSRLFFFFLLMIVVCIRSWGRRDRPNGFSKSWGRFLPFHFATLALWNRFFIFSCRFPVAQLFCFFVVRTDVMNMDACGCVVHVHGY